MRGLCPLLLLLMMMMMMMMMPAAHGASYFGDSYCRIDAVQDLSSFHVSLTFKSSRRSGLLLLAAGHQDWLSLELHIGRLQAKINMGSGEKVLTSAANVQLNNLLEHHVSLTLSDSKLTMVIDSLYTTDIMMEQGDEVLNIDQGVFLGGVRELEVDYLNTAVPYFRGCMSDVKFESHSFDILASETTDCYDTKDTCSSEFEAGDGETTSLFSTNSFIAFPTWTRNSNGSRSLEMLMKTTIEDSLLLFHPGQQVDFIAIGMVAGNIKGVLGLSGEMIVLENTMVKVDDDQWHRVEVHIDPSKFQINVDSQLVTLRLNESEKLDLVGNLYLGGIQAKMKDVFQDDYLSRVEEEVSTESFIGCLGEIKVNHKDRSLQDALITKDIHAKCEGDDDYSGTYDYLETTTALPVTISHTEVEDQHCLNVEELPAMFQNVTKLLEITPLLVPEGGEAEIGVINLNPTFSLNAAGVRLSQIIFTLVSEPRFGLIDMNLDVRRTKRFTMLDVVNRKIRYLHDGNYKNTDQIQLEVTVQETNLPECLSGAHQYVLPVEILPVNDVPQVSAGNISITANGRTRLSPNLIKISNSDTRCDALKVTVTSDLTPAGHLEDSSTPGEALREFTCRQLKDGKIFFVHRGGDVTELTLEVSDEDVVSHSVTFKLLITPQLKMVTNTGLLVSKDGMVSIGIQHLSASAIPRMGDIEYKVTKPLKYGSLELVLDDEVQSDVELFHQSDLEQNRLRYLSHSSKGDLVEPQTEVIHFIAQLGQVVLPGNTFLITVLPSDVKITETLPVEIAGGQQKVIKLEELEAADDSLDASPKMSRYSFLRGPEQGVLMRLDQELSEVDTFTKQDVVDGFISYSSRIRRPFDVEDQFLLKELTNTDRLTRVLKSTITIKADVSVPTLTNEQLVVLEGHENIISKDHLWVQTTTSADFVYKITEDPKHGHLFRDSPPGVPRFSVAIRVFSNEDLLLNRLIYKHDGSATKHDRFAFQVFHDSRHANAEQEEDHALLNGVFDIITQARNNHVPQRVIHKPFDIVRNGQRLLTTDSILFTDDDPDFNDTQLIYVRVGILSGNIVSSTDPTLPLYRFTQADLRDRKILFVHHGADSQQFQLQVSDGLHKASAVLQVQADEPYLRLANNSMVIMDHGSTKTFNTSLLSVESNMDIRSAAEFVYHVTSGPSEGRMIVSGVESSRFTQEDLSKGVVSYEHSDQSLSSKDSFVFRVQAKDLSLTGTFKIKIFKKGYLSEPQVLLNQVIVAYEGEHSYIDQENLKIEQPDITPKEMVYTVRDFPRLGHVVKLTNGSDSTSSPMLDYIQSFTQEDVNAKRILYVSASHQGHDYFTVDVSNGFTAVEDLEVHVDIVPRIIPVAVVNLTVREGESVALTPDVLNITHPFYRSVSVEFSLEEAPRHGDLRYLDNPDGLVSFTWEDVQQGAVHYVHDGSENSDDLLVLVAVAFDLHRRSSSLSVGVAVVPVNDEAPSVRLNTGLELLAGEAAEITGRMLSTADPDTPAEELVYSIETPTNGIVAFKSSPQDGVDTFTQAQIDGAELLFIHQGSESGGFSFTVTDGQHTSPLYRFTVTTRQLSISVETSKTLMVFPGTRQVISGDVLHASTNEHGAEIIYSLLKPPRLGRIIKPNQRGQFEEITEFTQAELNGESVYYEHQMPLEPFWVLRDLVELVLTAPPAAQLHHTLPVTVSYYAANENVTSQLWRNKGVWLVQGQSKVIDSSVLDASNLLASLPEQKRASHYVTYEVRRFPAHGRLVLKGSDLPRTAAFFTQDSVTQGDLEYHHQDSDASSDSFSIHVYVRPKGFSPQPLSGNVILEEVFTISVRRRDSNPPELVTLELLLEALQGSTTIISKNYLNTVDQDSTPGEIQFLVSRSPANGHLIHTASGNAVSRFSQEDVDRGQVAFVSDGSLADGIVEFTVSDGKHHTKPYTLHIGILAKSLVLKKAPEIYVKQGDDETLITEDMLSASTGGPVEEEVLYKITSVPKYASVMVDRQPTSAFTQKQIQQGRVSVRFVKSTSPKDSVAFVARSRAANVSSALNITVKPLAKVAQHPLIPKGATVLLDRKLLDATPLANRTRSSPTFSTIQQPQGARLVRRGGPDEGQSVSTFTQRDLDEGKVALEVLDTKGNLSQDEVRFLLKAHGVPPAECVLPFTTVPYDPSRVYGATLLKTPPPVSDSDAAFPRGDGGSTAATPVVSRRHTLWAILIPILAVLLLMLVAALMVYFLVRRNKTGKHDVQPVAGKPKNGEVAQETFRKTDPANSIPMSNMESKGGDPELIQHCRTTSPEPKKNQYWV